jgi:hypothetical protein
MLTLKRRLTQGFISQAQKVVGNFTDADALQQPWPEYGRRITDDSLAVMLWCR